MHKTVLSIAGPSFDIPEDEKALERELFEKNKFNLYLSDTIAINRSLPDVRHQLCRNVKYAKRLPDTSVILIFHNEDLTTLLRSVRSVIDRSPRSLLKEIILVDDYSKVTFMTNVLDEISRYSSIPIKVIKSPKRIGLIRCQICYSIYT